MLDSCFLISGSGSLGCKAFTVLAPPILAILLVLHGWWIGRRIHKHLDVTDFGNFSTLGLGLVINGMAWFALSHLGALYGAVAWLWFLLPALDGRFFVREFWRGTKAGVAAAEPMLKLDLVLVCVVAVRWFGALVPQAQGDPLYYHLASAWLWVKAHQAYFVDWLPWELQGGLAEYLYAWLGALTGERFFLLLTAQLFHAAVGIVAATFLVRRLAALFMSPTLASLAALAFVTLPNESAMLIRAKNDGFILFLAMLAVFHVCVLASFSRYENKASHHLFWTIFFAAAAFAVKHTAAFVCLPVGFFAVVHGIRIFGFTRQTARFFALGLGVACLLALPILTRNYVYTKDPFFPAMGRVFPSPYLNESILQIVDGFSRVPGTFMESVSSQWSRFISVKPWYVLAVFAFLTGGIAQRTLLIVALGCFLVLVVVTGKGQYARFGFALYAMLAILGGIGVQEVYRRMRGLLPTLPYFLKVVLALLAITVGSSVEVPFKKFFRDYLPYAFSSQTPEEIFATSDPVYWAYKWMNEHLVPGKILGLYRNENYFLDMPLSVAENEVRANRVRWAGSAAKVLEALQDGGFRYVLDPGVAPDYCPFLTGESVISGGYPVVYEKNGVRILEVPTRGNQNPG